MRETGRVTSVLDGRAEVEVTAQAACGHCGAHGVCNWAGVKVRRVLATNQANARPGDAVVLDVAEGGRMRSSLVVFGTPVLLMLSGVLVGGLVFGRDLWAGVLSGVGLGAGVLIVKLVDISVSRSGRSLPVIVCLADESEPKGVTGDETCDRNTRCRDGRSG